MATHPDHATLGGNNTVMVQVRVTSNLTKILPVNNEKELEVAFINQLKAAGWFVETQKKTEEGNRIDVLAMHHSSPTNYFIFELKYFTSIHDYTKAFKQVLNKYYEKKLTYKGIFTSLITLITPLSLYHNQRLRFLSSDYHDDMMAMTIERFFWRMGFGVGSLEDMTVTFTSIGNDATINLIQPNDKYRSLNEKIKLIKERQHWDDF